MAIEMIKIRAEVNVGRLSVATPYVQSFNVRKQRGQVSTFDASLKVSHDDISGAITGGNVVIKAGEGSASEIIFTGMCKSAKISPCYDDPKYVILSISGADQMSLLQGKQYTRRCRATSAAWVAITGVIREGLKSSKFAYTNEPMIVIDNSALGKSNVIGYTGAAPSKMEMPKAQEAKQVNTLKPPMIIAQIQNPVEVN